LDLIGLIPGFGEPADLLNGAIYLAEGRNVEAGLSFAGAVPVFGWSASAAKWSFRGIKAAQAAKKTAKVADAARTAIKEADKAYDVGAVARTASRAQSMPRTNRAVSWLVHDVVGNVHHGAHEKLTTLANRYGFEACFAAKTPIRTPSGWVWIEDVLADMLVLSRDESDPNGLVVAKRVEEVFVREALIWELTVGGRVLRTTAEHPFHKLGDDWTPTHELRVGDRLRCEDGSYATVDAVRETGEWETVYNVRIADFHTYFVGCAEWGFSVWAHNTYETLPSGRRAGSYGELRSAGIKDRHHVIQDASVKNHTGYSRSKAPAVEMPGPSTSAGSDHYLATRVQDLSGGGIYAAERRIGYKALRRGGYSRSEARDLIAKADDYFIGELGFTMNTPTRIPGNR